MLNTSNTLSLLRAPLAFVLLHENSWIRLIAIFLAMVTDGLDGYYARRYRQVSQLGALLDPLMDKFFVCFALALFLIEGKIAPWEAITLVCRDFSIILFGIYLSFSGHLSTYQFRSIWCGKITTAFQFFVLIGLVFNVAFPFYIYAFFIILGALALAELYFLNPHSIV